LIQRSLSEIHLFDISNSLFQPLAASDDGHFDAVSISTLQIQIVVVAAAVTTVRRLHPSLAPPLSVLPFLLFLLALLLLLFLSFCCW